MLKVEPSDIEACHRLPGQNLNKQGILQPRRTIVRFINRKNAEKLQRQKKILKSKSNELRDCGLINRIYINNSLCPYYRMILGKVIKLQKQGNLFEYWIYNGVINILEEENSDPIKVTHISDIDHLLEDRN